MSADSYNQCKEVTLTVEKRC